MDRTSFCKHTRPRQYLKFIMLQVMSRVGASSDCFDPNGTLGALSAMAMAKYLARRARLAFGEDKKQQLCRALPCGEQRASAESSRHAMHPSRSPLFSSLRKSWPQLLSTQCAKSTPMPVRL
jgi:hypothetical protein